MLIRVMRVPAVGLITLLALGFTLGFGGCRRKTDAYVPPQPSVTVVRPISREVIDWDEYTGRLAAIETVDVRARVSGFIESAGFPEGSIIRQGDVLIRLDPRTYRAALDASKALLAKSQAAYAYAVADFKRLDALRPSGDASELEYQHALETMREAEADVNSAKAQVETDTLNLEWCNVTAPIDGRISSRYVTQGNLVTGGIGNATLLTTIVSIDPIYCYLDVDERAVQKYQRLARERKRTSARQGMVPVFMGLATDNGVPHEGVIDFVDNKVDPGTGTLRARAVFENPDGDMIPGFFARVKIPGSGRYHTLLVPDAAVGTNQNEKFLLLVGPNDTVVSKPVTLGPLFGTMRSIESGIESDDRIIIKGLQRARPGTKVNAQETTLPPPTDLIAPGSPTTQELPATRFTSPDLPPPPFNLGPMR